jgi:thioredoxin reductase (NADPH)
VVSGKGIYYGASRGEANVTHGLDIYLIGGGNSAGQAALYFSNHARTVTLVVRGDSLEKSMSRYLVEQLRAKSNVQTQLRSEVICAHGNTHLTAIDVRDGLHGDVRRHDCGGLNICSTVPDSFGFAACNPRFPPARHAHQARTD